MLIPRHTVECSKNAAATCCYQGIALNSPYTFRRRYDQGGKECEQGIRLEIHESGPMREPKLSRYALAKLDGIHPREWAECEAKPSVNVPR